MTLSEKILPRACLSKSNKVRLFEQFFDIIDKKFSMEYILEKLDEGERIKTMVNLEQRPISNNIKVNAKIKAKPKNILARTT